VTLFTWFVSVLSCGSFLIRIHAVLTPRNVGCRIISFKTCFTDFICWQIPQIFTFTIYALYLSYQRKLWIFSFAKPHTRFQLFGSGEEAARALGIFIWPHSRVIRKLMPVFRCSLTSNVLNQWYNSLTNMTFRQ